jgi:hypothetical protein
VGRRLNRREDNTSKRPVTLAASADGTCYGPVAIDHSASQGRYIGREAHSVKAYMQRVSH